MKKAGIAVLIVGILLLVGSLYVARTVQNSAVVTQIAKVVSVDVNRENAGALLDVIETLLNDTMTDEEQVAKIGERLGKEFTARDVKVIPARADKLLAGGLDFKSRISLMLHPFDQVMNVLGLVAILGGGAMTVLGDKKKLA